MNLIRPSCFVIAFAITGARCFADAPPPLAVVHTWGDLQAQKPVTLVSDPSATCWLGIDCADAKLYGGAVLYCLTKGGKGMQRSYDGLGPFQVDVQEPTKTRPMQIAQQAYMMQGNADGVVETLYMKTIPLSHAGDYTIAVWQTTAGPHPKITTVAAATVNVANESGPIWSPWPLNAADGAVGLLARDDDPAYCAAGVANPGTGAFIPTMPLQIGIGADFPPADEPLPQLMPAESDPNIKLQVSGAMLIVTLDHVVQGNCVDEKFLSRWWVNGRPFVPIVDPPAFSMSYGMRHNGAEGWPSAREVGFQVEFHPEILGAKKGDAIRVQLLLCPEGAKNSGPAETQLMQLQERAEPGVADLRFEQPRMSNSVTFIYTGDPLRMAPLTLANSLPGEAEGK